MAKLFYIPKGSLKTGDWIPTPLPKLNELTSQETEAAEPQQGEPLRFGEMPTIEFSCTIGKNQRKLLQALRGKPLKLPRKMKKGGKPLFRIKQDCILLKLNITDDDLKFRTQWRRKAAWWLYLKLNRQNKEY